LDVTCVSRTPGRDSIGYGDLSAGLLSGHKLIVNTTPVGMHPSSGSCPPIPYDSLTPDHICYDLIYNPEVTLFMKKSAEKGAVVKNGLEMLHRQAESAWEIWKKDLGMS
ncbi:MAG: shikimate dehydrogenase, partial [Muribaculaceae bacterium]|nr:shikimate dehydrogenase [Muribaculaceae bacterium]